MAEWETSDELHNDRLPSKATGAVPGGLSHARKATPATALVAPHRYTLQFLIAAIKSTQRRGLSQQN